MYIDDILIITESETQVREHTAALIFLLENLGLVINYPKSLTTPSQVIEFLGFTINSKMMELKLPGEKIKKIRGEVAIADRQQCASPVTIPRQIEPCYPGDTAGNSVLQSPPMTPERTVGQRGSRLPHYGHSEHRMQGRDSMVGNPPPNMEWAEPTFPCPLP